MWAVFMAVQQHWRGAAGALSPSESGAIPSRAIMPACFPKKSMTLCSTRAHCGKRRSACASILRSVPLNSPAFHRCFMPHESCRCDGLLSQQCRSLAAPLLAPRSVGNRQIHSGNHAGSACATGVGFWHRGQETAGGAPRRSPDVGCRSHSESGSGCLGTEGRRVVRRTTSWRRRSRSATWCRSLSRPSSRRRRWRRRSRPGGAGSGGRRRPPPPSTGTTAATCATR